MSSSGAGESRRTVTVVPSGVTPEQVIGSWACADPAIDAISNSPAHAAGRSEAPSCLTPMLSPLRPPSPLLRARDTFLMTWGGR